jgi:fructose-bisphosphate aldolase class II
MPIATTEQYKEMLVNAKAKGFAYPAINIVNLEGINAALQAFTECGCDGMIQVSTGGGAHASGTPADSATGAIVLAEAAHRLAEQHPGLVVLHTDHCIKGKVDSFMVPLIEESERRVKAGLKPLFNSHMFDGSELPLEENLEIGLKLGRRLRDIGMFIEVESGVVGGEEDGIDNSHVKAEKLYTTSEDMILVYETLKELDTFMYAATFGNVHGVYKPGNVKLTPKILRDGQKAVQEKFGTAANPLDLVFHGGSGSDPAEIAETLGYGVIKMNVDTDTQYAFTRPIVDHMMKNYDGVLRIEDEMGNKKVYDPRSYLKKASENMKERIKRAVRELNAEGKGLKA